MLSKKKLYQKDCKEEQRKSNIKRFFNMFKTNKKTKTNYLKRSSHKFVDNGIF